MELNLTGCIQLTDEALRQLKSSLPLLMTLKLYGVESITQASLDQIRQSRHNLRVLVDVTPAPPLPPPVKPPPKVKEAKKGKKKKK